MKRMESSVRVDSFISEEKQETIREFDDGQSLLKI